MAKSFEIYTEDWAFHNPGKYFPYINKKNFPVPFFSIIGLLAEDANYELRDCYTHSKRLFITGFTHGKKNELMLRYNYGHKRMLVVARIEFIHKRKGKMTELYRILKRIQHKYHTGPIVIECVHSEEMKQWCLKNHFSEMPDFPKNYIQPLK